MLHFLYSNLLFSSAIIQLSQCGSLYLLPYNIFISSSDIVVLKETLRIPQDNLISLIAPLHIILLEFISYLFAILKSA